VAGELSLISYLNNPEEQRMSIPDFSALVSRHRNYFRSGATRPVEWREGQLTQDAG
jgi:hypothetical protein